MVPFFSNLSKINCTERNWHTLYYRRLNFRHHRWFFSIVAGASDIAYLLSKQWPDVKVTHLSADPWLSSIPEEQNACNGFLELWLLEAKKADKRNYARLSRSLRTRYQIFKDHLPFVATEWRKWNAAASSFHIGISYCDFQRSDNFTCRSCISILNK